MKIIRIILYIILFGAFGASLFVSYLYIKDHQAKPIPEELKEQAPEIINYSVNVLSVDDDKISAENMENQEKLEMVLTPETTYNKIYYGSSETISASKEDLLAGDQANINVVKDKNTNELKVEYIEILIPNE